MKLACKICGYESGNLVPHIKEEHGGDAGLAKYVRENGGIDSVVHPELAKKIKENKAAAEASSPVLHNSLGSVGTVKISGTTVQVKAVSEALKHHIPAIDSSYQFQPVADDVIADAKSKIPAMLIGHTGTGKTSLIHQIAARTNQGVLRVNMNGQTTVSDFVGFWGVKAGETYWVDGALPYAMRNGLWLIVDELDFAEPAILSVLNGVLERNGVLVLKEKGHEIVTPHEDFRIFATANAVGQYAEFRGLYQGTNILNEAFLDRWRCYVIDYMAPDLESEAISKVTGISVALAKEFVKVANDVRKAFVEETVRCTFSTRRLIDWAMAIKRYSALKDEAPVKAAEATIFNKISREDAIAVKGYIERHLLGKTNA